MYVCQTWTPTYNKEPCVKVKGSELPWQFWYGLYWEKKTYSNDKWDLRGSKKVLSFKEEVWCVLLWSWLAGIVRETPLLNISGMWKHIRDKYISWICGKAWMWTTTNCKLYEVKTYYCYFCIHISLLRNWFIDICICQDRGEVLNKSGRGYDEI